MTHNQNPHATPAFIAAAESSAAHLHSLSHLAGFAAEAAARVLLDNWRAAVRYGCERATLREDVAWTVRELEAFGRMIDAAEGVTAKGPTEPAKGGAEPAEPDYEAECRAAGWRSGGSLETLMRPVIFNGNEFETVRDACLIGKGRTYDSWRECWAANIFRKGA